CTGRFCSKSHVEKKVMSAKTPARLSARRTIAVASLSIASCAVLSFKAAAQDAFLMPTAMSRDVMPVDFVQKQQIPPLDLAAVQKQDEEDALLGLAPRYAVPHPVEYTPGNSGTWERLDRETLLWRPRVESPGAVSINLGVTRYFMPANGQLFIYSADMVDVIRPFTARDNADHGQLWTPPIPGEELIIELTIPEVEVPQLDLTLGSINVGYREFGVSAANRRARAIRERDGGGIASGSCNVDVVCPEGDDWRNEIAAVGVISTGGSRFCTGFMVNNTAQDRRPLFMTAAHCGINAGNAASLVVFWNYENSWCRPVGSSSSGGSGDGSLSMFQTGSTFRASYGPSDFTLVELSQDPGPSWCVTYAG